MYLKQVRSKDNRYSTVEYDNDGNIILQTKAAKKARAEERKKEEAKKQKLKTAINDISQDLSSISYLNSFDDETIRSLNLNIANKSRELKSLFGSGGANNGRLDDRTLLTQFKIVENSILLLLIVCVIFYFTKKNKVI